MQLSHISASSKTNPMGHQQLPSSHASPQTHGTSKDLAVSFLWSK